MKVSIRNPYHSEIVRNIPLEMFLSLKRAVNHTRNGEVAGSVLSDSPGPCVIPWAFHEHLSFFAEIYSLIGSE